MAMYERSGLGRETQDDVAVVLNIALSTAKTESN